MGKMASQITSLTIVYSTLYSDADQRKNQSPPSLAFVPAQKASDAENVSIWWRHHELRISVMWNLKKNTIMFLFPQNSLERERFYRKKVNVRQNCAGCKTHSWKMNTGKFGTAIQNRCQEKVWHANSTMKSIHL